MKSILILIFVLFTLTAFGQQMTIDEWEEQSRTNMRLLPKYGQQQKTTEQKQSDADFIETSMQQERFKGDRTVASNKLPVQLSIYHKSNPQSFILLKYGKSWRSRLAMKG